MKLLKSNGQARLFIQLKDNHLPGTDTWFPGADEM